MGVCQSNIKPQKSRTYVKKNDMTESFDDKNTEAINLKDIRMNINSNFKKAVNEEIKVLQVICKKNDKLEDLNLITTAIHNCNVLKSIDDKAKDELVTQMSLCKVNEGQFIFVEGNIGYYFYIIKSGKIKVIIKNEIKRILMPGDSFGELALIHGGERSASVQVEEEAMLWCLERGDFKRVVDYVTSLLFEENKKFVQSIPMLSKHTYFIYDQTFFQTSKNAYYTII